MYPPLPHNTFKSRSVQYNGTCCTALCEALWCRSNRILYDIVFIFWNILPPYSKHQTQICVTYQKVDCNPGFGLAFPCQSVMTARDFVHTYTAQYLARIGRCGTTLHYYTVRYRLYFSVFSLARVVILVSCHHPKVTWRSLLSNREKYDMRWGSFFRVIDLPAAWAYCTVRTTQYN